MDQMSQRPSYKQGKLMLIYIGPAQNYECDPQGKDMKKTANLISTELNTHTHTKKEEEEEGKREQSSSSRRKSLFNQLRKI